MKTSIRTRSARLLAFAAAAVLAGCASGPTIRVTANPEVDLTRFHTFAFFAPLGTDRPEYSSLLSQFLKDAARRELEGHGYRYTEADPELLVNFGARVENKLETTSYSSSYGYYGYRHGFYQPWPAYDTEVRSYQEGTLNIDVVNAKTKQMVWEGLAIGRVHGADEDELQSRVDAVVQEILAEFPAASAP